jgi:hypothetical protein
MGELLLRHTQCLQTSRIFNPSQRKPNLSPAECPEDALIRVRRVSIVGEVRLILIRSRENRQQLGKR